MKRRTFGRPERLRRNIEFRKARLNGSSYSDGLFAVSILPNGLDRHRLGVTISSSKVPLAKDRNKTKRRIKEFFRLNKSGFYPPYCDIVVYARRAMPDHGDYATINSRLTNLMKKARKL